MLLSMPLLFNLFCDGAADMQILALLTRSQGRVSNTQVTVKALGLLLRCAILNRNDELSSSHVIRMLLILC